MDGGLLCWLMRGGGWEQTKAPMFNLSKMKGNTRLISSPQTLFYIYKKTIEVKKFTF